MLFLTIPNKTWLYAFSKSGSLSGARPPGALGPSDVLTVSGDRLKGCPALLRREISRASALPRMPGLNISLYCVSPEYTRRTSWKEKHVTFHITEAGIKDGITVTCLQQNRFVEGRKNGYRPLNRRVPDYTTQFQQYLATSGHSAPYFLPTQKAWIRPICLSTPQAGPTKAMEHLHKRAEGGSTGQRKRHIYAATRQKGFSHLGNLQYALDMRHSGGHRNRTLPLLGIVLLRPQRLHHLKERAIGIHLRGDSCPALLGQRRQSAAEHSGFRQNLERKPSRPQSSRVGAVETS